MMRGIRAYLVPAIFLVLDYGCIELAIPAVKNVQHFRLMITVYICENIGGNKFLAMGVSPKWVKSKRRRKKKEERLNDGNNNGQATHGAQRHAWRTQAAWAKIQVFSDEWGEKQEDNCK